MVRDGLYHWLPIQHVHEEVPGFKTIVFGQSDQIRYKAGQYLTLVRFENGQEIRRSYSITSSPVLNEPLSIGVKRVENGAFSRVLVDQAKPGDKICTSGAGGFFVLPDDVRSFRQLVFFAAGSGITPVFSLIKTVLHAHPAVRVVLVYSNASPEKAVFLPALHALKEQFAPRFEVELLFSNAADLAKARLHRDLVFSYLDRFVGSDKGQTLFYICGPESYMRLCTYTLQEAGVPPANLRKENFYFSDVVKRDAAPPDQETHAAVIHLDGKIYSVMVTYPNSILRAAKNDGLVLPYSCEAGRCGNCVARCVGGKVWHSYNEVLTEKELQRGLVLTCVGHPVGGDVVLEIG